MMAILQDSDVGRAWGPNMMRTRLFKQSLVALALFAVMTNGADGQVRTSRTGRVVLVELFTSQGCDMCPTAEKILGELGDSSKSVAPVSLHVDYFNRPWKDPFSDALNSQRQMSYHNTYKGPKDPSLGLYYTPMMMVDGVTTVNGRNSAALKSAVSAALKKSPGVTIQSKVVYEGNSGNARLAVTITPIFSKTNGKEQLVCAILRDDHPATKVESGENAGKTLVNRFPSLKFKFEKLKFEEKKPLDVSFDFELDKAWDPSKLRFVIFVQDVATGEVHQTSVIPIAANSK